MFSRQKKMKMRNSTRKKWCCFFLYVALLTLLLYLAGLHQYILADSYGRHYKHWGPDHPLKSLINQLQHGEQPDLLPVNEYFYPYIYLHKEKCQSSESIRIAYIVKSAYENFEKRKAIRNSWGFENRFSDVTTRTVFLVGKKNVENEIKKRFEKEVEEHKDIIQGDFLDSYFNNTIKTMMGLHWTFHYCNQAKYFLFVDDDYYVSTRNVLRFLRDPRNYPKYLEKYIVSAVNEYKDYLFAGYVFPYSSPIRWYFSKWYITLEEYPYSHWPPYVTAGAYVLSQKSLQDLYYASIYTNFFRFDDIFLGMAAKKAGLVPFHHNEFYFDRKVYSLDDYRWVIASHGFDDPQELIDVWNEQRSAGNA